MVRRIVQEVPGCARSISATTRAQRPEEVDGTDYFFVSPETFQEMIAKREFFEWEEVHGHLYGTPKSGLEKALGQGKDLLLDIDTRGALTVKRAFQESCLIFLKPPSPEILERRLRTRKTEAETSLQKRLEAARRELEEQNKFDYVIINDDLERAVREVKGVIAKERAKRA